MTCGSKSNLNDCSQTTSVGHGIEEIIDKPIWVKLLEWVGYLSERVRFTHLVYI